MNNGYKNKIIELDFDCLNPVLRGSNHIEQVGLLEFGPRFNYAYQLLYVIEGEGRAVVNNIAYKLAPGQCFLYGPGDEHYFVQSGKHLNIGTINFSWLKESDEYLARENKSVKKLDAEFWKSADPKYRIGDWPEIPFLVSICEGKRAHMVNLIERIAFGFNQYADNKQLTLRAEFMSLLSIIQESLSPAKDSNENSLMVRLQQYLKKHLSEDLSRSLVAKALGMSASHLTTVLRVQHKTNFSEVLSNERMMEAQILLQYSDQQIKFIAGEVGFKDASYFVRVFRETYGASPDLWRQQFR